MSRFATLILKPNTYKAGQLINVALAVQHFESQTNTGAMDSQQIKVNLEFEYCIFCLVCLFATCNSSWKQRTCS
jgi:hypothetical protein